MNAKVRSRRRRRARLALQRSFATAVSNSHVRWKYPGLRNLEIRDVRVRRDTAYVRASGFVYGEVHNVSCVLNVRM